MLKKKRGISLLITLTFLLSLLLPMGLAFAGTTYEAITAVPEFDPASTAAANLQLAKIYVKIDPTVSGSSSALVEVVDANGGLVNIKNASVANTTYADIDAVNPGADGSSKTWEYSISDLGGLNGEKFTDTLTITVDAKGKPAGDVSVRFSSATGQLKNGSVVAAIAKGAAVEASMVTTSTMGDGGGNVTIRLRETAAGALKESDNSVKFRLPAGFKWASPSKTVVAGNVAGAVYADDRDLRLDIDTVSTNATVLDIKASIEVDSSQAKLGDIMVTISGDSSVSPSELKVGTYAEYAIVVSSTDTKTILAGQYDQEIGKFTIEEKLGGSLVKDRTITLTLPEGAKWFEGNYPTVSEGDSSSGHATIGTWSEVGTSKRTIKATVTGASSGGSKKLVLKGGKITVAADFTGDVNLEVGGSAGASGTVKVAEAKAPVEVTASGKPEVIIGQQAMAVADITITEVQKEAIQSKYDKAAGGTDDAKLTIETPPGVRFASVPKFTVTDGDLVLGTIKAETDRDVVEVGIKTASSVPSTVTVSDIKLIVDRTVPEGDITLKIGGTALVENNEEDAGYFENTTWLAQVPVATVITPPEGPGEAAVATFTIGSTTYTVGDTEQTMDVAPFIENGRTYLPIRYVAYAVGVSEDNIMWDGATSTATLIKGDRVVQLTINSNKMLINGATITMDVPAKMVSGRTMLPIRWVASALGCQVDWDEATQTVTVTQ